KPLGVDFLRVFVGADIERARQPKRMHAQLALDKVFWLRLSDLVASQCAPVGAIGRLCLEQMLSLRGLQHAKQPPIDLAANVASHKPDAVLLAEHLDAYALQVFDKAA